MSVQEDTPTTQTSTSQGVWVFQGGQWQNLTNTSQMFIRDNAGSWRLAIAGWVWSWDTPTSKFMWKQLNYQPPITPARNVRITSAINNYSNATVTWDPPVVASGVTQYNVAVTVYDTNSSVVGTNVYYAAPSGVSCTFPVTPDYKYSIQIQTVASISTSESAVVRLQVGHPQQIGTFPDYGWGAVWPPNTYMDLTNVDGDSIAWVTTVGNGLSEWIIDRDTTYKTDIRLGNTWCSEVMNLVGGSESGNDQPGLHCRMQGFCVRLRNSLVTGPPRLISNVAMAYGWGGSGNPHDITQDVHLYFADVNGNTYEGPGSGDPDNRAITTIVNGNPYTQYLVSDSRWKDKFFKRRYSATPKGGQIGGSNYTQTSDMQVAVEIGTRNGIQSPIGAITFGLGPNMAYEWNSGDLNANTRATATWVGIRYQDWVVTGQHSVVTVNEVNNSAW